VILRNARCNNEDLCCSSLALLNSVLAMLCLLSCVQSVKSCVNLWFPGLLLTLIQPRGLSFRKKRLQYICFRLVLSGPNKNNRADLIFDMLAATTDTFVSSWDERFYCMLAKVRIPVIGRSVATVFTQMPSLNNWPSRPLAADDSHLATNSPNIFIVI